MVTMTVGAARWCFLYSEATLLRVILSAAPTLSVIVEQPSGSWCYKQWFMEILIEDFDLLPVGQSLYIGWDNR